MSVEGERFMKKLILIIFLLLLIIFVFLKIGSLGYNLKSYTYDSDLKKQSIILGVPKLSVMGKENDRSYSYKNIRGNKVLKKEVKNYLNTLKKIYCNDTTYYYDKDNDFTIINYSVKNNIFYNTITYDVRYGNYCFYKKAEEYSKKMGGMLSKHSMGNSISLSPDKEFKPMVRALFTDGLDEDSGKFTAELVIEYLTGKPDDWRYVLRKDLEKSSGTYEIKGDKLYYTRDKIIVSSEDIIIPKTSVFKLDDGKLILEDNYLASYVDMVVLEQIKRRELK